MASDFALALAQTLNGLEMTQLAFADAAGISHSLVTKLLGGEEAHRKTYLKIFAYLRRKPKSRPMAKALMEAYLRDVARDIGIEDEYDQAELTVSTRRESAIAHAFRGVPVIVLQAFYAVGVLAKGNDIVFNGLMNLAETAIGLDRRSGANLPENYFSAGLRKPAAARCVLGGSLGDLFSKISSADKE